MCTWMRRRAGGVVCLPLPFHAPSHLFGGRDRVLGWGFGQAAAGACADDRVAVPGERNALVGDAVDGLHVCLRRVELDVGGLGDVAGSQLGAGPQGDRYAVEPGAGGTLPPVVEAAGDLLAVIRAGSESVASGTVPAAPRRPDPRPRR